MSNSKLLISFSLFFFFISIASSSSFFNNTRKCSTQDASVLLQFKGNLSSINDTYYDSLCQDWLGSQYYSIMMNWNKHTDCCKWDGVTCDHFTGDVIGIDLSCGMLQGTIHPNNTLFQLPHLQKLNLAYNDITASRFPREISGSLTHLNISQCGFTREIPSEISFLPKLVSLDLTWNSGLQIHPNVLNNLLQNSTHLRELLIADVQTGWVLPTYLNISSPLKSLDLSNTDLHGKLPHNIFNIEYLEKLDMSDNFYIIGPFPKVITNQSSLKSLALSLTRLKGKIPNNIFNIRYLEKLDLSVNFHLYGPLPKFKRTTNIPLKWLDLSSTKLSGEIPHSIGYLKSLNFLALSNNNLSGEIPEAVGHLKFLNYLELYACGLVGSLPKSLVNLRHLITLALSGNKLNGTLPSFLFTFPLLEKVDLDVNLFSGGLPLELFNCQSLKRLVLGHNQFNGEINVGSTRASFIQLTNLTHLDLSSNSFTGLWELETLLSILPNLKVLNLSYSGLSVVTKNNATNYVNPGFKHISLASCKLTMFPESLRAMKNLQSLDLSNNYIHGHIPHWAGEIGRNVLFYLDISNNSISSLPEFQWNGLYFLYVQSNQIQGPFPPSICNMKNLIYLDMSNNRFDGVIPQCFANTLSSLVMVDIGNNHFHGTIPIVKKDCKELKGLRLNGNQLQGEVPSSFSKCQSLIVLDMGNNQLNGTFPRCLGELPMLQVLVLKSNKLHGLIEISSTIKSPFPSLQVLDLSHNRFVGHLPGNYFQTFNAMKNIIKSSTRPEYVSFGSKYYSMIVAVKGAEQVFPQIFVGYTIIDLSNNKFEGEIPDAIGSLSSLIVLDLSHNNLNNQIPCALGNLLEIQSLDLSWNQLTGEIPQTLADLTFLEFLNLSQNHLVGHIPQGTQLSTFDNSFGGNPELCGRPLPKKCEHPHEPQLELDEDIDSGFTWRVVMLGYGCGALIGLNIGYLMLSTGRPKWFNAIADAGERIIQTW